DEDGTEMIIPLNKNRRTDAMKLLALTAKMLGADGGDSKRPRSLPNVNTNNNDNGFKELLKATLEQNEILMKILYKDTDIVMNDRVVATQIEPIVSEIQNRTKKVNNSFKTNQM